MTTPSGGSTDGVTFSVVRDHGQITDIRTSSPDINHFLRVLKLSRAHNTWLSYALDLKAFFGVVQLEPRFVGRAACLSFIEQQDREGYARTTINRRLAAVSALFNELNLLDPVAFATNPVNPARHRRPSQRSRRSLSLYSKQPERDPDVLAPADLQRFCTALPTWRDRTIVMLLWMSCLRIGEALAIRFEDIECSRRSIRLPECKGGFARTVFMDPATFTALNRYLDTERKQLFPEQPAVFIAMKGPARGQPLSVNAFQKLLAFYAAACDLPGLHAHCFRHTGITQLLQHGMTEPAVRAFVGHHHPLSLLPYLHLTDTFVEAEFAHAQAAFDFTTLLAALQLGGAS